MTFYQDMQKIATTLLGEFNQGVIEYGKVTPGNGPVDNPGPSSYAWTTVKATARGVSEKYIRMSMAVATDLQVTMAVTAGIVPNMKDVVRIDGVVCKITSIIPKPAAGTVAAYILIVRK
jgi:hypothetical protein